MKDSIFQPRADVSRRCSSGAEHAFSSSSPNRWLWCMGMMRAGRGRASNSITDRARPAYHQCRLRTRTQKRRDRWRPCTRGRSMAVVGMAADPSGAHHAGRHRAGHMFASARRAEGRRGCVVGRRTPPHISMAFMCGRQETRRFSNPTNSVAAAGSNVAPEKFRAITRTVLLVQENADGQRRQHFVALQ